MRLLMKKRYGMEDFQGKCNTIFCCVYFDSNAGPKVLRQAVFSQG